MAKELYANNAATFLAAAVSDTDTSLSLVTASSFPTASGQYTVRLGDEICLVTAFNAGTKVMTVVRAQEGTTAVAHGAGEVVFLCLTDGALRRLARQSLAGTNVAARREFNLIPGAGLAASIADDAANDKADVTIWTPFAGLVAAAAPPSGGWTLVNSGASFAWSFANNALQLAETSAPGGQNVRALVMAAPATPYHVTASFLATVAFAKDISWGLCFRESGTGKIHGLATSSASASNLTLNTYRWTNPTTYSGTNDIGALAFPEAATRFLRIGDDGTNLTWSHSADGVNFRTLLSLARTAYMAGGPDQVGLFLNDTVAGVTAMVSCIHWAQSP